MKGRLPMSKRLGFAALLLGAAAVVPAQTVDEIVVRNVAARGGAAAWRAVQSLRSTGSMDVGRGMRVPFRLEQKRPRRMRLEFDFAGATVVQTYDGSSGWTLAPHLGRSEAEPLTPEELAAAAGQAELDGPLLDYAAKGHRIELLGRESLDGREAYKLRLTLKGGAVRTLYVDAQTGLETQVELTQTLRGQPKLLRTRFGDYRTVDGLRLPHLLESRLEGAPYSHKLLVTSVEVNPPIAETRFGRPEASAAPKSASNGGGR